MPLIAQHYSRYWRYGCGKGKKGFALMDLIVFPLCFPGDTLLALIKSGVLPGHHRIREHFLRVTIPSWRPAIPHL